MGLSPPNNEPKTSDSPTHLAFVVLPVGEGWGAAALACGNSVP